ncbi:MAG: alpha-glucan family phosphorylase [Nanobdellota archaeon]
MEPKDAKVAYFSMEIGIESSIPTYSGGLGVLAGDMLRSASQMNMPLVGITLIYHKGYFRQKLDSNGTQQEKDNLWNPHIHLKKLPDQVKVNIEGREVKIGCWIYEGDVPVIFLDTDIEGNSDYDRTITDKLYGFDDYYRLAQEIVLGIGGTKMVRKLGAEVEKYHMNEGHSSLLGMELYEGDLEKVRKKCVFTTHTPVPAGHDVFEKKMAEKMLGKKIPPGIKNKVFNDKKMNMTHLGLMFSGHINGVAKKHTQISKEMFPGYNIESITNGVHSGFWTSPHFRRLFNKYIPNWEKDPNSLRSALSIPNEKIWDAHRKSKKDLINFVNKKHNAQMKENVFTIGFARRAATYKRGTLLLSRPEKLKEIARDTNGIQIIYSGKAHPHDEEGKKVIREIIGKSKELKDKIKICYVENYNIDIAKKMVAGVDIWLNTPLRPKEASGTSGMKAAHNGVPHFSVLDGWWIEGHIEDKTGWSIGEHPSKEPKNDEERDIEDLYNKLEYVILPKYYKEKDEWINIMSHVIAINASFFNTHRMVQQYVQTAYFN